MKTSKLFIGLTLCLLFTLTIAFANSAIPQVDPDNGAIRFMSDSGIVLVEEKIVVDLYGENEVSEYKIDYNLKNTKSKKQSYEIWFVAKATGHKGEGRGIGLPKIYDDHKDYAIKKVPSADVVNWQPRVSNRYIDPYSKEVLAEPIMEHRSSHNGNNSYDYFAFEVEFQPNESKLLTIEYSSENGYLERVDHKMGVFITQVYYLTPALFYEGDVSVDVEVRLKNKGYKFASNMLLEKVSNNHYIGHFDQLPKEEITFTMQKKAGKIFGTNRTGLHSILMLSALGVVFWCFKLLYMRSGRFALVKDILIIVFMWLFIGGFSGTGINFVFYVLYFIFKSPVGLVILAIVALIRLVKYYEEYKDYRFDRDKE